MSANIWWPANLVNVTSSLWRRDKAPEGHYSSADEIHLCLLDSILLWFFLWCLVLAGSGRVYHTLHGRAGAAVYRWIWDCGSFGWIDPGSCRVPFQVCPTPTSHSNILGFSFSMDSCVMDLSFSLFYFLFNHAARRSSRGQLTVKDICFKDAYVLNVCCP